MIKLIMLTYNAHKADMSHVVKQKELYIILIKNVTIVTAVNIKLLNNKC